jgi:alpha-galactosidase/6-phospho-beta-glucosidase family protein/DNA-binding CsgD family transcriptional regulator
MPKIAFIGAGSTVFAQNLLQDLFIFPELRDSTIALMDISQDRLDDTAAIARRVAADAGANPTIEITTDRRRALDGADYAINMIQVGGYQPATAVDFDVPKRHGLRQTIGDTLGIGGIMRALRTIPVMLDMARDMEEVCPDVLFLNYTNPMAMLCWAMARASRIKTVGLCHSVQGTAADIAEWIGVPFDEVNYVCAGINHVAFYLRLERNGESLYPALRKLADAGGEPPWERVRFEVFRQFGYFVTESSEHFSEYVPWFIKRDRPDLIERYNIPLDEYPARCEDQIAEWQTRRAALHDPDPAALDRYTAGRRSEWQALIDLGFLWAERDYAQTGDLYQQARDLATSLADPLLRARSLNRLGNWLTNVGRAEEALHAHREALALFVAQGDDRGAAETQDLLGMTNGLALGDVIASAAHYDRAIALIRAGNDPDTLVSSLTARMAFCNPFATETLFSPLTPREDCVAVLHEARALARQHELPAALAFAEYVLGQSLAGYGEFGAALAHAREGLRIATEIDHQQWRCGAHCMLGVTYVAMLAPDRAIPHLETGLGLGLALGSAWWIGMGAGYLALAHLLAGSSARAEAALAPVMPTAGVPRNAGERRMVWAWGELALARGASEVALQIADDLMASAPGETRVQPIPTLLRLRGEALLALRRLDEAAQALDDAKRGAIERGTTPLLWRVHRALTRLHLARRQPVRAWQDHAAAREIIAELATSIDEAPERERFMAAAVASLPALPKRSDRRRLDAERFGGLTAREREVATQIALGKTNREIAACLFTAERTVASHVGSILAKLDFSSRAQVAVWAREHDLVESP